jgi:RimJ/RimL family protein N-acetyltransferase
MNIPISTQRLRLREYTEADFEGVHAYSQDLETVRFMTWGPNTPEDTQKFIQLAISQQAVKPRVNFHFVIALQETDQIIGGCGIHIQRPEHRGAEIGYCFNRVFWGQGYATETMEALLKFGFEALNLHRIIATCDPRNIGSERVMQKNGLRKEAHYIQELWQKNEWRDSLLYAILDHEWQRTNP